MIPGDFYMVLADHYKQRIESVIRQGKKYSKEYFFLKASMGYYKSML